MKVKNILELKTSLEESEGLRSELEKDPLAFLNKVEQIPPMSNKKVFLTVVYMVGGALLISIVLVAIMIFLEKDVDDFFVMIASASIGALAGLLVPSPEE